MSSREQHHVRSVLALVVLAGAAVLLYGRFRRSRQARGPVPLTDPARNTEERLDEALLETFPASDPIATHIE